MFWDNILSRKRRVQCIAVCIFSAQGRGRGGGINFRNILLIFMSITMKGFKTLSLFCYLVSTLPTSHRGLFKQFMAIKNFSFKHKQYNTNSPCTHAILYVLFSYLNVLPQIVHFFPQLFNLPI